MSKQIQIHPKVSKELGFHPQTGQPLPAIKREYAPQDRFQRALNIVFDGIGGIPTMTQWAKRNQGDFYKMYAKAAQQAPINITDSEVVIVHSLPASKLDE